MTDEHADRLKKIDALREAGIDPFGGYDGPLMLAVALPEAAHKVNGEINRHAERER